MAKNVIHIDLNKWSTQDKYAERIGVSKQVINNWIRRDKIDYWTIHELGLRLVKIGSEKKDYK